MKIKKKGIIITVKSGDKKIYGRRNFDVLLHHSNKFGIILEENKSIKYTWNCCSKYLMNQYRSSKHNYISSFQINYRHIVSPLNFE